MKSWDCQLLSEPKSSLEDVFYQPETSKVEVSHFTIGQIIRWQCKGEVLSDISSFKIMSSEAFKDQYRLEEFDWLDNKTFNLAIRPLKAYTKEWPLALTNGKKESTFALKGLKAEIHSILKFHDLKNEAKEQQAQENASPAQAKAYPLAPGISMNYPPLLWIILAGFIIGSGFYITRRILFNKKIKNFRKQKIAELGGQTALKLFYKEMRSLYRDKLDNKEYIYKLEQIYTTYLENRLLLPCSNLALKTFFKYAKKQNPRLSKQTLSNIKSYLKEFKASDPTNLDKNKLQTFVSELQSHVGEIDLQAEKRSV